MKESDQQLRVVIAITESTPIPSLWRAAMQAIGASPAEIVALFLHDERWQRAASLPFTREISAIGRIADFTLHRADQLLSDTAAKTQKRIEQLATEADVTCEFRVMPESDASLPKAVTGRGKCVLIAPSFFTERPFYPALAALDLHILLVEANSHEA